MIIIGYFYLQDFFIYFRYRNSNARHTYEKETKTTISNLRNVDKFVKHENGLSNARMKGANNNAVQGQSFVNSLIDQSPAVKIFNDIHKKGSNQ